MDGTFEGERRNGPSSPPSPGDCKDFPLRELSAGGKLCPGFQLSESIRFVRVFRSSPRRMGVTEVLKLVTTLEDMKMSAVAVEHI